MTNTSSNKANKNSEVLMNSIFNVTSKKQKFKLKPFSFSEYFFSVVGVLAICKMVSIILILKSIPDDVDALNLGIDLPNSLFSYLALPVCIAIFCIFMFYRTRVIFIPLLIIGLLFSFAYEKVNGINILEKRYQILISEIEKDDVAKSIFYKNRNMKFVSIKETSEFKEIQEGMVNNDSSIYEKYINIENQSKLIQISASNKQDLEKAVYRSKESIIIQDYNKINEDGIITIFEFNWFKKKYVRK